MFRNKYRVSLFIILASLSLWYLLPIYKQPIIDSMGRVFGTYRSIITFNDFLSALPVFSACLGIATVFNRTVIKSAMYGLGGVVTTMLIGFGQSLLVDKTAQRGITRTWDNSFPHRDTSGHERVGVWTSFIPNLIPTIISALVVGVAMLPIYMRRGRAQQQDQAIGPASPAAVPDQQQAAAVRRSGRRSASLSPAPRASGRGPAAAQSQEENIQARIANASGIAGSIARSVHAVFGPNSAARVLRFQDDMVEAVQGAVNWVRGGRLRGEIHPPPADNLGGDNVVHRRGARRQGALMQEIRAVGLPDPIWDRRFTQEEQRRQDAARAAAGRGRGRG